jgi:hypothetical protein
VNLGLSFTAGFRDLRDPSRLLLISFLCLFTEHVHISVTSTVDSPGKWSEGRKEKLDEG